MADRGEEMVFVYGTLRPPRPGADCWLYPRIAAHVRAARPAHLPGAVLYDLGAFPGARPGRGTLQGDLLAVGPEALAIMDVLEGHPDLFRRARVAVQTAAGAVEAWIYWAGVEMVAGRPRIASGDWFIREKIT